MIQILSTSRISGSRLWTPLALSGLVLWMSASNISGVSDGGSFSGPWLDRSATGASFSASVAATYRATGKNGKPTLEFAGGGPFTSSFVVPTRPFTAIIVGAGTAGRSFSDQVSGSRNWLLGCWNGQHAHYADGFAGTQPSIGSAWAIDIATDTATDSTFYENGTSLGTAAVTGQPTRFAIGGDNGGGTAENLTGPVGDALVVNRTITAAEITLISRYFGSFYSVTVA